MIVYDVFTREGCRGEDHGDGSFIYRGEPGETWVATVSSKKVAVENYCQLEVHVIRDRIGTASECEDLDAP